MEGSARIEKMKNAIITIKQIPELIKVIIKNYYLKPKKMKM